MTVMNRWTSSSNLYLHTTDLFNNCDYCLLSCSCAL